MKGKRSIHNMKITNLRKNSLQQFHLLVVSLSDYNPGQPKGLYMAKWYYE